MGNDTWKWALVLVLSAIFILVAHSAYKSLHNADDQFPPPDDYMKGDSYELEHGNTPGPVGATPIDGVPAPASGTTVAEQPISPTRLEPPPASFVRYDASEWDNLNATGTP